MKQSNKDMGNGDRWWVRAVRRLREWQRRHGRTAHDQMIRGVSYGIGSGAVSILVVWWQSRH